MKIKFFYITFVVLIAFSILSSLLIGDVSSALAQSSRLWTDPVNLSNSGGASNPVLVVDGLGVRHAFWTDEFDGYRYIRSEDGKVWTSPKVVKFPFNKDALPVLIPGQNGLIHVFWQDRNKSLISAQANSATFDNPSTWGFNTVLAEKILVFDVSLDARGALHVAYIRDGDTTLATAGVYYLLSSDAGRSWFGEKPLYQSQ